MSVPRGRWQLAQASPFKDLSLELASGQKSQSPFLFYFLKIGTAHELCFFWRLLRDRKTSAVQVSAAEIPPKRPRRAGLASPGDHARRGRARVPRGAQSVAEWSRTGRGGLTELAIRLHRIHLPRSALMERPGSHYSFYLFNLRLLDSTFCRYIRGELLGYRLQRTSRRKLISWVKWFPVHFLPYYIASIYLQVIPNEHQE